MRRLVYVLLIIVVITVTSVWFVVTQPIWVSSTIQWDSIVRSDRLKRHVEVLSNNQADYYNRLNFNAQYIQSTLSQFTDNVELQTFRIEGKDYYNVVATFGPKNTDEVYVVGAHYDAFANTPGADDNASGVAGIIELARLFSQNPPAKQVQLVAFTTEEPPYFRTENMGSFQHAQKLYKEKKNIILMISFETIGYFSEEANSQTYPVSIMEWAYPTTGNFIAIVASLDQISEARFFKEHMRLTTPLPVYSINAPASLPGIDFSDHLNYWQFNFPAIMITDTAFYRNKNYHTSDDTPDTLDYEKMAMVVQAVYVAITEHMKIEHD